MKLNRTTTRSVTGTGILDLTQPEDSLFNLSDIANGLAKTCRYNGQCFGFISVAEHSIAIADKAYAYTMNAEVALAALLHDAHEAYTGDLTRPYKEALRALGVDMTIIEELNDRFTLAIRRWAGVRCHLEPHFEKLIKNLDTRICLDEHKAGFEFSPYKFDLDCEPLDITMPGIEWYDVQPLFIAHFHKYHNLMTQTRSAA